MLAEEEAHHERHRRGECDCPTIFDSEERERRLRPRSGKGKANGKEVVRAGENMEVARGEGMSILTSLLHFRPSSVQFAPETLLQYGNQFPR